MEAAEDKPESAGGEPIQTVAVPHDSSFDSATASITIQDSTELNGLSSTAEGEGSAQGAGEDNAQGIAQELVPRRNEPPPPVRGIENFPDPNGWFDIVVQIATGKSLTLRIGRSSRTEDLTNILAGILWWPPETQRILTPAGYTLPLGVALLPHAEAALARVERRAFMAQRNAEIEKIDKKNKEKRQAKQKNRIADGLVTKYNHGAGLIISKGFVPATTSHDGRENVDPAAASSLLIPGEPITIFKQKEQPQALALRGWYEGGNVFDTSHLPVSRGELPVFRVRHLAFSDSLRLSRYLRSCEPEDGSTEVSTSTQPRLTFQPTVSITDVASSVVLCLMPVGQPVDAIPIPITIAYDDVTNELTATPLQPLLPFSVYRLYLKGEAFKPHHIERKAAEEEESEDEATKERARKAAAAKAKLAKKNSRGRSRDGSSTGAAFGADAGGSPRGRSLLARRRAGSNAVVDAKGSVDSDNANANANASASVDSSGSVFSSRVSQSPSRASIVVGSAGATARSPEEHPMSLPGTSASPGPEQGGSMTRYRRRSSMIRARWAIEEAAREEEEREMRRKGLKVPPRDPATSGRRSSTTTSRSPAATARMLAAAAKKKKEEEEAKFKPKVKIIHRRKPYSSRLGLKEPGAEGEAAEGEGEGAAGNAATTTTLSLALTGSPRAIEDSPAPALSALELAMSSALVARTLPAEEKSTKIVVRGASPARRQPFAAGSGGVATSTSAAYGRQTASMKTTKHLACTDHYITFRTGPAPARLYVSPSVFILKPRPKAWVLKMVKKAAKLAAKAAFAAVAVAEEAANDEEGDDAERLLTASASAAMLLLKNEPEPQPEPEDLVDQLTSPDAPTEGEGGTTGGGGATMSRPGSRGAVDRPGSRGNSRSGRRHTDSKQQQQQDAKPALAASASTATAALATVLPAGVPREESYAAALPQDFLPDPARLPYGPYSDAAFVAASNAALEILTTFTREQAMAASAASALGRGATKKSSASAAALAAMIRIPVHLPGGIPPTLPEFLSSIWDKVEEEVDLKLSSLKQRLQLAVESAAEAVALEEDAAIAAMVEDELAQLDEADFPELSKVKEAVKQRKRREMGWGRANDNNVAPAAAAAEQQQQQVEEDAQSEVEPPPPPTQAEIQAAKIAAAADGPAAAAVRVPHEEQLDRREEARREKQEAEEARKREEAEIARERKEADSGDGDGDGNDDDNNAEAESKSGREEDDASSLVSGTVRTIASSSVASSSLAPSSALDMPTVGSGTAPYSSLSVAEESQVLGAATAGASSSSSSSSTSSSSSLSSASSVIEMLLAPLPATMTDGHHQQLPSLPSLSIDPDAQPADGIVVQAPLTVIPGDGHSDEQHLLLLDGTDGSSSSSSGSAASTMMRFVTAVDDVAAGGGAAGSAATAASVSGDDDELEAMLAAEREEAAREAREREEAEAAARAEAEAAAAAEAAEAEARAAFKAKEEDELEAAKVLSEALPFYVVPNHRPKPSKADPLFKAQLDYDRRKREAVDLPTMPHPFEFVGVQSPMDHFLQAHQEEADEAKRKRKAAKEELRRRRMLAKEGEGKEGDNDRERKEGDENERSHDNGHSDSNSDSEEEEEEENEQDEDDPYNVKKKKRRVPPVTSPTLGALSHGLWIYFRGCYCRITVTKRPAQPSYDGSSTSRPSSRGLLTGGAAGGRGSRSISPRRLKQANTPSLAASLFGAAAANNSANPAASSGLSLSSAVAVAAAAAKASKVSKDFVIGEKSQAEIQREADMAAAKRAKSSAALRKLKSARLAVSAARSFALTGKMVASAAAGGENTNIISSSSSRVGALVDAFVESDDDEDEEDQDGGDRLGIGLASSSSRANAAAALDPVSATGSIAVWSSKDIPAVVGDGDLIGVTFAVPYSAVKPFLRPRKAPPIPQNTEELLKRRRYEQAVAATSGPWAKTPSAGGMSPRPGSSSGFGGGGLFPAATASVPSAKQGGGGLPSTTSFRGGFN